MEKLIELLNEYEDYKEKETEIRNYTRRNVKCDGVERIECLREVDGELFWEEESTAIIICKGYMFIKWLVDNDKIDYPEIWTEGDPMPKYWFTTTPPYTMWRSRSLENIILMCLSISDEPIQDLIELLRTDG